MLDAVKSGSSERVRNLSKLIVYPDADHFLAVDSRYMEVFAADMINFLHELISTHQPTPVNGALALN